MTKKLLLNKDYYLDKFGNMIFTREYHLERGYCCQSGCLNCPFKNSDPFTPHEFTSNWSESIQNEDDDENND